jgi:hypothetical protein
MEMERRWINQAKNVGALRRDFNGSMWKAKQELKTDSLPLGVKNFLEASFNHLSYQFRVPTLGEKAVQTRIRAFAENLEETRWFKFNAGKRAVRALHRLDHKHPIDAIRSATFHSFLGFFNPAQYFVQASGATVAFSIEPQLAGKVLPKLMKFQVLDNIHDKSAYKHWINKLPESDVTDEYYKLWDRSGLRESVVTSNADFQAMANGHYIGKGQVARLLDKGLFFYKAGEMFNRRYSFITSVEKFRSRVGRLPKTDSEIKEVIDQTNDFLLHMSRANKAVWQKGVTAIPTQFFQVHSKFVEGFMKLTPAEKAKLIGTQFALFGAAGFPFMETIIENSASVLGLEEKDINEEVNNFLKKGAVWGTLAQDMMGIDVEGTNRQSIFKGLEDMINGFLSGDSSWYEIAAGASGGLFGREATAISDTFSILRSAEFNPSNLNQRQVVSLIDTNLDVISSWNNLSKAYEIHNGPYRNPRTGRLLTDTDPALQTKIFQALGFTWSEFETMREEFQNAKFVKEYIEEKATTATKIFLARYGDPLEKGNYPKLQGLDNENFQLFLSSYFDQNDPLQVEARERFIDRLLNPQTKREKAIKSRIQRELEGMVTKSDLIRRPLEREEGNE